MSNSELFPRTFEKASFSRLLKKNGMLRVSQHKRKNSIIIPPPFVLSAVRRTPRGFQQPARGFLAV